MPLNQKLNEKKAFDFSGIENMSSFAATRTFRGHTPADKKAAPAAAAKPGGPVGKK